MTTYEKEVYVGLYNYPAEETWGSADSFIYAFFFCRVYS